MSRSHLDRCRSRTISATFTYPYRSSRASRALWRYRSGPRERERSSLTFSKMFFLRNSNDFRNVSATTNYMYVHACAVRDARK